MLGSVYKLQWKACIRSTWAGTKGMQRPLEVSTPPLKVDLLPLNAPTEQKTPAGAGHLPQLPVKSVLYTHYCHYIGWEFNWSITIWLWCLHWSRPTLLFQTPYYHIFFCCYPLIWDTLFWKLKNQSTESTFWQEERQFEREVFSLFSLWRRQSHQSQCQCGLSGWGGAAQHYNVPAAANTMQLRR